MCAVLGLWLGVVTGYFLWGVRAAALDTAMERLTLEDEVLRARLGAESRGVNANLAALAGELSAQSTLLSHQTESLALLADDRESQLALTLHDCSVGQEKMQAQLESCLFTRAELERSLASMKQAAARPRAGKQTVTETVVLPQGLSSVIPAAASEAAQAVAGQAEAPEP